MHYACCTPIELMRKTKIKSQQPYRKFVLITINNYGNHMFKLKNIFFGH